jgi:hypothetical protein
LLNLPHKLFLKKFIKNARTHTSTRFIKFWTKKTAKKAKAGRSLRDWLFVPKVFCVSPQKRFPLQSTNAKSRAKANYPPKKQKYD